MIGRYWNACAALSTPINCNDNAKNSPIPGTTTHPDQHAALFVPDGNGGVTLFAGSDGGVYSQHVNAGADFTNDDWGDGDNVGIYSQQPYDAEIANDGTVSPACRTTVRTRSSAIGHQAEIFGGDAFFSTIDPTNSNNIIEEYTYGALSLTNDGGASWFNVTPSSCSSSTALFATPIEQDPLTDGHIVVGCTQIQESTNSYANPCVTPSGAPPATCVTQQHPRHHRVRPQHRRAIVEHQPHPVRGRRARRRHLRGLLRLLRRRHRRPAVPQRAGHQRRGSRSPSS